MQLREILFLVFVHIVYLHHVVAINCVYNCFDCDYQTGMCRSCVNNIAPPQCKDCIDGYWKIMCTSKCGRCKNNQACSRYTGECNECQVNYQMPQCLDCINGFWGSNCSNKCGFSRNNQTCNQTTGECTQCQQGYEMPFCSACIIGKYGSSCQKNCNCYNNYDCDKLTGSCRHYGCAMLWSGKNKCDTKNECPTGQFGTQCVPCGKCKMSCGYNQETCEPDCNRTSGECLSHQCKAHYTGKRCDSCVMLRYGLHCQYKCGQCLKDMCNKVTGLCFEGCKSGYTGNKCDIPCKEGRYGYNCAQLCGQCADNIPCSHSTGECPGRKCADGFEGDNCQRNKKTTCPSGLFGRNCKQNCGNCTKHTTCNQVDGTCLNGCLDRYEPPFCYTCSKGYFGKSCEQSCGHCKNKEICDGYSGACPQGCADGFTGYYCKKRIGQSEHNDDHISDYFDIDNF